MALHLNLEGKVAFITGVSSGIGQGIAKMLALAGCDIAGCGFSSAENKGVIDFKKQVADAGRQTIYVQADVTQQSELQKFVEEGMKRFGKMDILVSNAGKNIFEGAADCSEAQWEENINLNLASHWRLSKMCYPHLKTALGVIIIITSNHAYATMPGCFPYNVTKTALTGLVRSLCIEWGPAIRVVGLAPGFIQTPGNDTWFNSFADPENKRNQTIELHPVKALGTVEQVGGFCAFLASDFARFASGATYLFDGGRSALMQDE